MSLIGCILRTCTVSLVGCAIGIGVLLTSPAGRRIDHGLTAHFADMNIRRAEKRLTLFDGVQCYLLYHGIAVLGWVASPEGAEVIKHYLDGQGHDLWLNPGYLQRSPVIRRSLALLQEGESRRFTFNSAADRRLGFAVNPFHLKKTKGKALLWQKIEFDTRPSTYTIMDYRMGSFRLPDALVYAVHPQAFTVYAEWNTF